MQHWLWQLFVAVIGSLVPLTVTLPAVLFLWAWERVGPCHGRRPSAAAQVKGVLFEVLSLAAGVPVAVLVSSWLPRAPTIWPALAFPLAFLLGDFIHYWEHRVEHTRLFWRFHAVHHSTQDMSASSNFNHFTHHTFMAVIYGLPLAWVTRNVLDIPAVMMALYVQAAYLHSPAKIGIGPLRYVFNDNRVHRIHHSVEDRHWNRNFGAFLVFWDFLFGTLYWPKTDEWPETGVPGHGEIDSVWDFLGRPFRAWPRRQRIENVA